MPSNVVSRFRRAGVDALDSDGALPCAAAALVRCGRSGGGRAMLIGYLGARRDEDADDGI